MNETLIAGLVALLNTGLRFGINEHEHRRLIAKAIAEGRDLTREEIMATSQQAQDAIDTARNTNRSDT